ncbi:YvcK family protein [archaeon]|jgi:uncharacterized cofD-like protein|nr:YvcK family protein [archaeon]MBT3451077.1 YvcK family protein [archaeon]MBT6869467.1 YvcK family protein [archaeon]MBT7193155.1 YvcK family protein [archaeon]MBT7380461.1 YvcK family protein [archaeon]
MRKVVVIGGGTGSYTVLRGLKKYPLQLFSIVNMFDSGGSTGILRDELGVLPPGDVRRCLLALSSDDEKSEILRDLFQFRFEGGVNNHSLGNLILTASEKNYGNIAEGIKKLSKLLGLEGEVIPVSLENAQLCAKLADGQIIYGESKIDIPETERGQISEVYLDPKPTLNEEAKEAMLKADLIVIGPGDLYTSLIPNLLVEGVTETLLETKAKIVYVCNLMTKKGETDGFIASKFLSEIENYVQKKVDYVICNEANINRNSLEHYRKEGQYPVVFDLAQDERAILANLTSIKGLIRHDGKKLARELVRLC